MGPILGQVGRVVASCHLPQLSLRAALAALPYKVALRQRFLAGIVERVPNCWKGLKVAYWTLARNMVVVDYLVVVVVDRNMAAAESSANMVAADCLAVGDRKTAGADNSALVRNMVVAVDFLLAVVDKHMVEIEHKEPTRNLMAAID